MVVNPRKMRNGPAVPYSLIGFDETMSYGMPSYVRDGTVEVAWASQKNHVSVYILRKDVLDADRHRLSTPHVGKGCIRYSRAAAIDFDVVRDLLVATRETPGPVC